MRRSMPGRGAGPSDSRAATPAPHRRTPAHARPARPAECRGRGWRCGPVRRRPRASRCVRSRMHVRAARRASRDPDCPAAPRRRSSRRRRASAASVCQSTPITSAPVGIGDFLQRPPRTRRKGDDRRSRLARDPHGLRHIRKGELAEIPWAQRTGPGVEELDRLRSRPYLGALRKSPTARASRSSSAMRPLGLLHQESLGDAERLGSLALRPCSSSGSRARRRTRSAAPCPSSSPREPARSPRARSRGAPRRPRRAARSMSPGARSGASNRGPTPSSTVSDIPMACGTTRMSLKMIAASTPIRSTGWRVTSTASSGVRTIVRKSARRRTARYSGR